MAAPTATGGQILVMLRLPPEHFRADGSYGGSYGDGMGAGARRRVAERLAKAHGLTVISAWPMPVLGVDCYLLSAPKDASPEAVAADLSKSPEVAWSEPVRTYHAETQTGAPNDPLYPMQPIATAWRLADLHRVATGRNVRVAVIDSRVDVQHPDLTGQVEVARDFVSDPPDQPESHGTAVAGIIAAVGGNRLGVVGVAPGARLLALRACHQQRVDTVCDSLSLARALNFAIENRAQVINMSLSGPDGLLLGRLVDTAMTRGAVVVGAVDPALPDGGFPASHAGVIAVARDDGEARPRGAYSAPGRDVPTTLPHGRWALVTGSSFAAAHVSGLLALLREKAPRGGADLVAVSAGRIDACASLRRAGGACACDCGGGAAPQRPTLAR